MFNSYFYYSYIYVHLLQFQDEKEGVPSVHSVPTNLSDSDSKDSTTMEKKRKKNIVIINIYFIKY